MNVAAVLTPGHTEQETWISPRAYPVAGTVLVEANNFTNPRTNLREAIELCGEKVIIKPEFMLPKRPYFFEFLGVSVAAVKRPNGVLDFYHLPQP